MESDRETQAMAAEERAEDAAEKGGTSQTLESTMKPTEAEEEDKEAAAGKGGTSQTPLESTMNPTEAEKEDAAENGGTSQTLESTMKPSEGKEAAAGCINNSQTLESTMKPSEGKEAAAGCINTSQTLESTMKPSEGKEAPAGCINNSQTLESTMKPSRAKVEKKEDAPARGGTSKFPESPMKLSKAIVMEREVEKGAAGLWDTTQILKKTKRSSRTKVEKKAAADRRDTSQSLERPKKPSKAMLEMKEDKEDTAGQSYSSQSPQSSMKSSKVKAKKREENKNHAASQRDSIQSPESPMQSSKAKVKESKIEEGAAGSWDTTQSSKSEQKEAGEDPEMEAGARVPFPQSESCQFRQDELFLYSRMLLLSFFRVFADGEEVGSVNDLFQLARPNTTLQILLRVARDTIESNHECFYNALDRLDIERPEHLHKLSRVTFELFGDGVTNWGRVATLLSFCALVARHLKNLGMDDSIFMMADGIARFLTVTKRYWFLENRGWDGFVAVYSVRWLQIRVGLVVLGLLLGITGIFLQALL